MAALALPKPRARTRSGVGPLGLGVATLWLSVVVLLPLTALLVKSIGSWDAINTPAARAALVLTIAVSALVALIDVVTGTLIAWVLVRDEFRGKHLVNAVIDLPFALPTIVASIVLLALYGPHSPVGLDLYATRPALDEGKWVLSDRFVDSSLAYQGGAGGLGIETVREINAFAIGDSFPDRTLVLVLHEGRDRAFERDRDEPDRIGGRSSEYHHKVETAFCLVAAEEPERVKLIDASGKPEQVTQRLLDAISDLLP